MDTAVLEQMPDETFDHAVVHHGYTNYVRDYEVIVYATADPRTGITPAYLRYLFQYRAEAFAFISVPMSSTVVERFREHGNGHRGTLQAGEDEGRLRWPSRSVCSGRGRPARARLAWCASAGAGTPV
jgi:hypothetical protein